MRDRRVAEKRHRAVRDATERLDLAPPDAAMTDADAIDVERLGNDHVIDARLREITLGREVADAAVAARFLVDGTGDLQRAGEADAFLEDRFDRDDRCREAALHVARAAAVDPTVAHDAGERIDRPRRAGLDDVDVRVEVDARTGRVRRRMRATTLVRG